MLAGAIMDRAAVLLNDSARTIYTYTVQLPYLNDALEELSQDLANLGLPRLKKWSGALTVTAGQTDLDAVPSDLLLPIELYEKGPSETDDFYGLMKKMSPLEPRTEATVLGNWDWIQDAVAFIAATQDRTVKMYYYTTLTEMASDASTVFVADAKPLMAAKTAELLARFIGGSEKRADALKLRYEELFAKYVGPKLGQLQSTPVRKIPWGGYPR